MFFHILIYTMFLAKALHNINFIDYILFGYLTFIILSCILSHYARFYEGSFIYFQNKHNLPRETTSNSEL